MWNVFVAWAIRKIFGGGFTADVASRGISYLTQETIRAIRNEDEFVTRQRLQPGETYTVIARPAPSRRERKLAKSESKLRRQYESLSAPSRKQKRIARDLAKAQRKTDRARPGSTKHMKCVRREQELGIDFDRAYRPSPKLLKVAAAYTKVSEELAMERESRFQSAHAKNRTRRPTTRRYSAAD